MNKFKLALGFGIFVLGFFVFAEKSLANHICNIPGNTYTENNSCIPPGPTPLPGIGSCTFVSQGSIMLACRPYINNVYGLTATRECVSHTYISGTSCSVTGTVESGCADTNCGVATCGDGTKQPDECCDDGRNGDPSDGCDDSCTCTGSGGGGVSVSCGDGICNLFEGSCNCPADCGPSDICGACTNTTNYGVGYAGPMNPIVYQGDSVALSLATSGSDGSSFQYYISNCPIGMTCSPTQSSPGSGFIPEPGATAYFSALITTSSSTPVNTTTPVYVAFMAEGDVACRQFIVFNVNVRTSRQTVCDGAWQEIPSLPYPSSSVLGGFSFSGFIGSGISGTYATLPNNHIEVAKIGGYYTTGVPGSHQSLFVQKCEYLSGLNTPCVWRGGPLYSWPWLDVGPNVNIDSTPSKQLVSNPYINFDGIKTHRYVKKIDDGSDPIWHFPSGFFGGWGEENGIFPWGTPTLVTDGVGRRYEFNGTISFPSYSPSYRCGPRTPTLNASTSLSCGGKISLTWNSVSSATGYKLFRDGSVTPIYDGPNTSFEDTGLTFSSTHSYTILAYNASLESALSSPISATASDECVGPEIGVGPDLTFTSIAGGVAPSSQSLNVFNDGDPLTNLLWKASTDVSWCKVNGVNNTGQITGGPEAHGAPGSNISVTVDSQTTPGSYSCQIEVEDNNSVPPTQSPLEIVNVTHNVNCNPATVGTNRMSGCVYLGTNFNTLTTAQINEPSLASPAPGTGSPIPFIDWGSGGPGGNSDNFSIRWKGRFNFTAGVYVFTAGSDDGFRLYFDDNLDGNPDSGYIINDWVNGSYSPPTVSSPITVTAGNHTLVAEYYESGGQSSYSLSWAIQAPPTVDLRINSSAGPVTVNRGQTGAITWAVTGATACTASNNRSDSTWTGSKAAGGGGPTNSSVFGTSGSFTYSLSCTGPGGTTPDSVAVTVPVCNATSFSGATSGASPTSVTVGDTYTVTCDYGVFSNQITPTVGSGSCVYSGQVGTRYSFTCTAGNTPGTFTNSCRITNDNGPEYYCASTNAINSITITPDDVLSVIATNSTCEQIGVSWPAAQGATSYRVYRNTSNILPGTPYLTTASTSITENYPADIALNPTRYYYWVQAVNGSIISPTAVPANTNSSGPGVAANLCPGPNPPATPVTLNTAANATVTCETIRINWSAPSSGTIPTGYRVFRNTVNSTTTAAQLGSDLPSTTFTLTDANPLDWVNNYYWVVAFNAGGPSDMALGLANPAPIAKTACEANFSSSDKDIIGRNGTTWTNSDCNAIFEQASPPFSTFQIGDVIKFQINACNSGAYGASGVIVTDQLTNLSRPTSGWQARINNSAITQAGNCLGSLTPLNQFSVCGTVPNETLTFNLGSISIGATKEIIFDAVTTAPSSSAGNAFRFQNTARIDYLKNVFNQPGLKTAITPLLLFNRSLDPTFEEVAR